MGNLSKLLKDVGEMDELVSIRQYSRVADATGGWVETASYLAEDIWAKFLFAFANAFTVTHIDCSVNFMALLT